MPSPITVYATLNDIINAGIPAPALENVPTDSINECLVNASSEIDSYLASTYTLPFTTINGVLTQKCVNLASWYILNTRGFDPGIRTAKDATVRMAYEDTIRFLERIAMRKSILVGVVDSGSPADSNPTPVAAPFFSPWNIYCW